MAIVEVVEDVSWYDTFYDAASGSATPDGWTKYGTGAIEVISDPSAYGGKYIKVANSAAVGLGMNIAGSPENYEVLMRMRISGEISAVSTVSLFGGPAGRITSDASPGGVMLGLQASPTVQVCNWTCQQATGEFPEDFGKVTVVTDGYTRGLILGGKTTDRVNHSYFSAMNGLSGVYDTGGQKPETYVPQKNGTLCLMTGYKHGDSLKNSFWIKLRVMGRNVSAVIMAEDNHGAITMPVTLPATDIQILNAYWPVAAGPVGFLSSLSTGNVISHACLTGANDLWVSGVGRTYIDMISVSLDPLNYPAYIPPDPVRITTQCPLPTATRGQVYSFELQSTLPTV